MACWRRCDWTTDVLDNRWGWEKTSLDGSSTQGKHNVVLMSCRKCGGRRIDCIDQDPKLNDFALTEHSGINLVRLLWIEKGEVWGEADSKYLLYLNKDLAPMGGFEQVIKELKSDPEFTELLSNQMVDDALGQLEVAVKLHYNNQPKEDKNA